MKSTPAILTRILKAEGFAEAEDILGQQGKHPKTPEAMEVFTRKYNFNVKDGTIADDWESKSSAKPKPAENAGGGGGGAPQPDLAAENQRLQNELSAANAELKKEREQIAAIDAAQTAIAQEEATKQAEGVADQPAGAGQAAGGGQTPPPLRQTGTPAVVPKHNVFRRNWGWIVALAAVLLLVAFVYIASPPGGSGRSKPAYDPTKDPLVQPAPSPPADEEEEKKTAESNES